MSLPCDCVDPAHERDGCAGRRLHTRRGDLWAGLYDGSGEAPAPRRGVRLLNAGYAGDDATLRRFAHLEIE